MSFLRCLAAAPAVLSRYRNFTFLTLQRHFRSLAFVGAPITPSERGRVTAKPQPAVPWRPVEQRHISTLKRRVFKIKKHKKKKRKKRLSRQTIIPWRPPSNEKQITYQLPYKMRRIVKERRRRNKGNRTRRVPRQR